MSRKDFYSLCVAENKKQVQCKSTEARNKRQHSTPGSRPGGLGPAASGASNPPHSQGRRGRVAAHALMLPAWQDPHLPFLLGQSGLAFMFCGRNGCWHGDLRGQSCPLWASTVTRSECLSQRVPRLAELPPQPSERDLP